MSGPVTDRLALIFAPAPARAAIEALDTVVHEIKTSVSAGLDHHVAHTRLVWWREEIARLIAGQPLHPATRQLHACVPGARYTRLDALITACEFELAGHQPTEDGERDVLYGRVYGAVEALRCDLALGGPDARLDAYATALGRVLGTAERLELALFEERTRAAAALREALRSLAATLRQSPAERHGLVRAEALASRLTVTGLATPPNPFTSLYRAWRCVRRHRLELT